MGRYLYSQESSCWDVMEKLDEQIWPNLCYSWVFHGEHSEHHDAALKFYDWQTRFKKPMLILGDSQGAAHVLNNTSVYWRPEIDRSILSLWVGVSSRQYEYSNLTTAYRVQSVWHKCTVIGRYKPLVLSTRHIMNKPLRSNPHRASAKVEPGFQVSCLLNGSLSWYILIELS